MDGGGSSPSVSNCVSSPTRENTRVQLNENEENWDLNDVAIKMETETEIKTEDEENQNDDDGLRVQVLNFYCYECRQLFPDSDSFNCHIQSFHKTQNYNENPVLKPKTKCKTRVKTNAFILKEKTSQRQAISTNWNRYNNEEEEFCLEGKDRVLVECKKCRKNYTSLSGFLKHLKRKKKKENKTVQNEETLQEQSSFSFHSEQSNYKYECEDENENEIEVKQEEEEKEEKWEETKKGDFDSNYLPSVSQVDEQNDELESDKGGEESDEWKPEDFHHNLKKKRTSPKKKKSTKIINNENEEKKPPPSIDSREESSASTSQTASTTKKTKKSRKSGFRPSLKSCNICNFSHTHIKELREHKRTMHQGQKPFMCHLCSACFKCESYLQKHMRIHDKSRNVKCPECGKGFGNPNHLNIHMVVHSDVRPWLCPEPTCPFATVGFKLRVNLTAHIEGIHKIPEEMQQCSHCDKMFKTKALLRCHMRIHAEGRSKKFVCNHDDCGKSYFYAYQLASHQRENHSVIEEKFPCPICKKKFKRDQIMKTHVKLVHQKIKKYICELCGAGFGKGYSLKVHQRTHSGVRLFACRFCIKDFTTKQLLINHNLKCHPDKDPSEVVPLPPQNQPNSSPSSQTQVPPPTNNNNYYSGSG